MRSSHELTYTLAPLRLGHFQVSGWNLLWKNLTNNSTQLTPRFWPNTHTSSTAQGWGVKVSAMTGLGNPIPLLQDLLITGPKVTQRPNSMLIVFLPFFLFSFCWLFGSTKKSLHHYLPSHLLPLFHLSFNLFRTPLIHSCFSSPKYPPSSTLRTPSDPFSKPTNQSKDWGLATRVAEERMVGHDVSIQYWGYE